MYDPGLDDIEHLLASMVIRSQVEDPKATGFSSKDFSIQILSFQRTFICQPCKAGEWLIRYFFVKCIFLIGDIPETFSMNEKKLCAIMVLDRSRSTVNISILICGMIFVYSRQFLSILWDRYFDVRFKRFCVLKYTAGIFIRISSR